MVAARRVLSVLLGACTVAVAGSMLGVASAEAPTSGSAATRVVDVEGFGTASIAKEADQAAADAAYRGAMAAAVADGREKAELLASKASSGAGPVQEIVEQGGSVQCWLFEPAEGEYEDHAVPYEGAQPDFGSAPVTGADERAVLSAPAAKAPVPKRARAKSKKHKAKAPRATAAAAPTCTVSAGVYLRYELTS